MTISRAATAAAALSCLCSYAAAENLISNGSFESPKVPTNTSQQFSSVSGWTVSGKSQVAIFNGKITYPPYQLVPERGQQWVNFPNMALKQTVSVARGKTYTLTFWLGDIYADFSGASKVVVNLDGKRLMVAEGPAGSSTMHWAKFTKDIKAESKTMTLEFKNNSGGDTVIGLDNVSLVLKSKDKFVPSSAPVQPIDDRSSLAPR